MLLKFAKRNGSYRLFTGSYVSGSEFSNFHIFRRHKKLQPNSGKRKNGWTIGRNNFASSTTKYNWGWFSKYSSFVIGWSLCLEPRNFELKISFKTILKLFPDQKCLTFMDTGHSETFEQFEIKTNNIAANLLANGVKPGDRLGQFP